MENVEYTGNWSLFIGRYQPFHEGHIKLMRTVLNEKGKVCIGLRDTLKDKNNPYSIEERFEMIEKEFATEMAEGTVKIVLLPDIKEICYGRKVGWGIREIKLDEATESISATKIRNVKKWK